MNTQPLRCSIEGDELVIRIGINTLAFAFNESEDNHEFDEFVSDWRQLYVVIDEGKFASDVALAMNNEAEDGSAPLTLFLDKMMQAAADDGSMGIEECEVSALKEEK